MTRREFYVEYYQRTDREFSDKYIWGHKQREEAWRKRQWRHVTKLDRKLIIAVQYLTLLLCWIPICFDRSRWAFVPMACLVSLCLSFASNFSFIKVETLYAVFRRDCVYASILHDIFLGTITYFLDDVKRATKKVTTGFVRKSSGIFREKYFAMCRDKNNTVLVTFHRKEVTVAVNGNVTVIDHKTLTKEQLIDEIAGAINKIG